MLCCFFGVSCWLSVDVYWMLPIGCSLLVDGCQLLVFNVGGCLLLLDCWSCPINYWLYVFDRVLLVIVC